MNAEELQQRAKELESITEQLAQALHKLESISTPLMVISDGERELRIFPHDFSNAAKVKVAIRTFMKEETSGCLWKH